MRTLLRSQIFFKNRFGIETLTKLIDATVETFSKRSADLLFSTILYQSNDETNLLSVKSKNATTAKQWLDLHGNIGNILGCFT